MPARIPLRRGFHACLVAWRFADRGWPGLTAGNFDDGRADVPGGLAGPAERVVVVGAGIAGLTVANALAHGGVECVVLEARDRIGGRLHTVDLAGSPVDLGGSWIHMPGREPDARLRRAGRCPLPQREPAARAGRLRLRARDGGCRPPRSRRASACSWRPSRRRSAACAPNSGRTRPRRTGSRRSWPGPAWRRARRGGRGRRCTGLSRPSRPAGPSASRCAGCGTRSNTTATTSVMCRTGATGAWSTRWPPVPICGWAWRWPRSRSPPVGCACAAPTARPRRARTRW